jgi:peptide/nickel transport system substrate-binding protein
MADTTPELDGLQTVLQPQGSLTRRRLLRGSILAGTGLVASSILAACGGDDDDDDDGGDDEPTADDSSSGGDEPTATEGEAATDPTATSDSGGETPQGGELIYALENRIDTLDPNVTTFSDVIRMATHMFDPLLWQPEPGEFIAGLAAEWEVNETADEYTFTFRDDVTFHDGTAFDANAVKFTFDKIIDPETRAQGAFSAMGPYESSEVVDDFQLVVHFTSPFAPFFNSVSGASLAPVSPAAMEELGADFSIHPVGTGPFIFDSYETDQQIRMVKNPDYNWAPTMFEHQGPPYLDAITWRIITEPATRLAALQSGEVHIIQAVPTQEIAGLESSDEFEIIEAVLPGSGWSLMNNVENPPNDDVLVRQALEWGVDKEGLIQVIWQGRYAVSHSPLTSITFGYDPSTSEIYSYDPDRASELLEEAGWTMGDDGVREKDGERLVMGVYYRSDNQEFVDLATFLQAQYKDIGIELELNGLAQAGYFDAVRAGQHNIQFWWGPATDPDGVFRTFFHSSNADGGTNRNRYRNPEVDALIDEAAGTIDPERRRELYFDLQHRMLEEAVMVFFSEPTEVYAYQSDKVINPRVAWSATVPLFYDTSVSG